MPGKHFLHFQTPLWRFFPLLLVQINIFPPKHLPRITSAEQKEDLVVFLLLFLHSSISSGLANPLMIQTTGCLVPRLLAVHQQPLGQGNMILFLIQKSVSVRRHSPCPRSPSCTSRRSSYPSLSRRHLIFMTGFLNVGSKLLRSMWRVMPSPAIPRKVAARSMLSRARGNAGTSHNEGYVGIKFIALSLGVQNYPAQGCGGRSRCGTCPE